MSIKFPEAYAQEQGSDGGVFLVPYRLKSYPHRFYQVIASNGGAWEHLSVCVIEARHHRPMVPLTPSWDDMNYLKNLFWEPEDCVMQLHPAESNYVNMHPNVLHLWRPTEQEIPMPPKEFV